MSILKLYHDIRVKYNIVWSFEGILLALKSFFNKKPKQVDILFLCHDVHRHAKKEKKLYAPLIDPIIEELCDNFKCLTLATPFSKNFGSSCFNDVQNYNYKILIGFLKRVLLFRSFVLLDSKKDPLIKAYESLLKDFKPKIIFGIQPSVEICIAAKRLGIKKYDIQHGIISDVNYYSILKREKIDQQGWPDMVLCWDKESSKRVDNISHKNVENKIIGNPTYHSKSGQDLYKKFISQRKDLDKYRSEWLITLTYLDYGVYNQDKCYQEIGIPIQVVNMINKTPEIFWRIRLHPVQIRFFRSRVDKSLNNMIKDKSNVDWDTFSNIPLGSALHKADGHLTVESASALDAAQNGIPTLLVGCPGVSSKDKADLYFREYIESGAMKYVNAPDLNKDDLNSFEDYKNRFNSKNASNQNGQNMFKKFIKEIKTDLEKR